MTGGVEDVLGAAQIAPQRLGHARTARLTEEEVALYHWILRSFARGVAPDMKTLATEADGISLDPETTLAKFAHEDLVHTDQLGAVAVAYPFSGRPTAHRVRIQGHEVYAMCAIDALGIAPMFGVPITIESTDPMSSDSVRVELRPDGEVSWKPEGAVVVAGSSCEGAAFRGCCHVLNFFSSRSNAESYLRERGEIRGMVISIPEAAEAGRCVFGNVFESR